MGTTNSVKFTTNSGTSHSLSFEYANKLFSEVPKCKFLGLYMDNELNWKSCIEKIIPKLSAICCAIKKLSPPPLDIEVLRMVYFENFQSVVCYGIIFWGNSTGASHMFLLQEKIMRIMMRIHNVGVAVCSGN